ncbi:MAG: hypothetical protein ACOZNI_35915 [Myxococcota bacterium]
MIALAALALAAPPTTKDLRVALDEVRVNVEGIKIKLQGYHQLYGKYYACGTPEAAKARGAKLAPSPWEGGDCWKVLAFNDPMPIRGGYWVVLTPGGYEVHGVLDGDGDGVFAEYVATSEAAAKPITPADEY